MQSGLVGQDIHNFFAYPACIVHLIFIRKTVKGEVVGYFIFKFQQKIVGKFIGKIYIRIDFTKQS